MRGVRARGRPGGAATAPRPAAPGRRAYTCTSARPSPGWPRGHEVVAPQELAAGDDDGRGRAVVHDPAVDLRPGSAGRAGEPAGRGRARCRRRPRSPRTARGRRRSTRRASTRSSSVGAPARSRRRGGRRPGRGRRRRRAGTPPGRRGGRAPRPRASASSPLDLHVGRARRRAAPTARPSRPPVGPSRRAATLDAATTPRWQASAAARAVRRGLGIGRDVADLAEQVDALLHVAHEVAAGHLVVVEHVGEVVARRPVVRRTA